MAENTIDIAGASQDLKTIEDFVNLPAGSDVRPRLLPSVNVGTLADTRQAIFEAGGLPATPFATKTLMEASALVDGDYAMVTNDTEANNNGLYVKKDGVWVRSSYDPLTQAKVDAENKVQALESSIVDKSYNLFSADAVQIGYYLNASGNLAIDQEKAVSDFIPVLGGENYTMSSSFLDTPAFQSANFFDSDKVFMARILTDTAGVSTTVTAPKDAKYVRLNIYDGLPSEGNRMFNKGSVAKPYDTPRPSVLKDILLNDKNIKQVADVVGKLTDYMSISENLFDSSKASPNLVISPSGDIRPPTIAGSYSISDFIPVEELSDYTISGGSLAQGLGTGYAFIHTAYYDYNKNFIKRIDTFNIEGAPKVITIPKGVAYVRFNINSGSPSSYNRMFNKGSVALPYAEAGSTLHSVKLSQDIIEQVSKEISPTNEDKKVFRFDRSIEGIFTTSQVWTGYTGFRAVKSDAVYAMYDELMAQHPSVITKHILGNDSVGNPIAYYKFTPIKPNMPLAPDYPTVFLECGMHGMEHMPPLATYLMLEQAYNNWQSDPLLEVLRHNVNFIIIPVSNPSGWNSFNRVNANGVDINRNFPVDWVETEVGATYSGPAPASELETQYVMQVFDENPTIDIYNNIHNFNGAAGETRYFYIAGVDGNFPVINGMGQKLSGVISRKWQKEYDWIPDSWVPGNGVVGNGKGMAKTYAYSKDIYLSTTFEVGEKWWIKEGAVAYDELHCKTAVELLVNWLLINLQELKRL